MRTLVAGGIVAGAIAAMLAAVTTGGENGWKFALAAVGLVLWILRLEYPKIRIKTSPGMDKMVENSYNS